MTAKYASLDDKIEAVLESVKKQKTDDKSNNSDYPFITFLSESKRDEFIALNETEKKRVKNALDIRPSFNEEGIVKVWESALAQVEVNEKWLTDMPVEYVPIWEAASADRKDQIIRQAKIYNLDSPYQIKNFWQTRGLNTPQEFTAATAASVNESATAQTVFNDNSLGYSTDYVKLIGEKLGKSFSR